MHISVVLDVPDGDEDCGAEHGHAGHDDEQIIPEVLPECIGKDAYAEAGEQDAHIAEKPDQSRGSRSCFFGGMFSRDHAVERLGAIEEESGKSPA